MITEKISKNNYLVQRNTSGNHTNQRRLPQNTVTRVALLNITKLGVFAGKLANLPVEESAIRDFFNRAGVIGAAN